MQVKHAIKRLLLGQSEEILLTEAEFSRLRESMRNLGRALAIEEKYDAVMENFVELETELLTLTVRHTTFIGAMDWSLGAVDRNLLNRRFLNLLASGRLYIDQVKHDCSTLFGKSSEEYGKLEAAFKIQYDTALGYRVIEALRNFTQHRSLPIYAITDHWSAQADGTRVHTLEFSMSLDRVQQEGNFNRRILGELRAIGPERVALKPLFREYVGCLGLVHAGVRGLLDSHVQSWERTTDAAEQRFIERHGPDVAGLALAAIRMEEGEERGLVESYDLFKDPRERRAYLRRKNAYPSLPHHIVSSGGPP